MECALRSHDVERAANNRAVGAQPAPLVERFLTSLCGEWWSEPRRPQSLCALADECRAPRNAVATATGEGACFGWSCPRATRARSRQYVLVLQRGFEMWCNAPHYPCVEGGQHDRP